MLESILAGCFAAVVAVLVTVAIERFGGVVGGFLGTIPSTILPASIGLWSASPDPESFAQAMHIVPAGMLLNVGFLYTWRLVPPRLPKWGLRRRLLTMCALSLSGWLLFAVATIAGVEVWISSGLPSAWIGWGTSLAIVIAGLVVCIRPAPAPRGTRPVTLSQLMLRGTLAATAIGFAVALGHSGLPLAAGIGAVFPAIYLTAMAGLWLAQGEAVPAGAVGPMMLGSASVATFALMATWLFTYLGPGWGAAGSWLIAVCVITLPASAWMTSRTAR